MALRDQPYLPLYVQDFLTDEKLIECSASATGIYIRMLCIMHKSDEYGTILLKQKDKQSDKQVNNFALKLVKFMPYSESEIISGLNELITEGVLKIEDDKLIQRRMIRDNEISIIRADAGKRGGLRTQSFVKAKIEANTEDEIVTEGNSVIDYKGVVDLYHSLCPKMNKVVAINEFRKGLMNARISEYGLPKVTEVIRIAGESEFLNGTNDKAWKADFEWIMRPQNFVKIMEGKYVNNIRKASDPKMSLKYITNGK